MNNTKTFFEELKVALKGADVNEVSVEGFSSDGSEFELTLKAFGPTVEEAIDNLKETVEVNPADLTIEYNGQVWEY